MEDDVCVCAIGQRIKELRTKQNLTQKELAEKIYQSRETMCYMESGKREPTATDVIRIAELFGVDCDYIQCGGKQK